MSETAKSETSTAFKWERVTFDGRTLRRLQPKPTGSYYDAREKVPKNRPASPGFVLRVFPNGTKVWSFVYQFQGKRRRLILGDFPTMSVADARERYEAARAKVRGGIDPWVEQKEAERPVATEASLTINDLCDVFLKRRAPERSRREYARQLDADVRRVWSDWDPAIIQPKHVHALLDEVIDRGSPVAANRLLALLKTLFKFAESRELVPVSPCRAIERPTPREVDRSRRRALEFEEIATMLQVLESGSPREQGEGDPVKLGRTHRDFIRMLLLTGQRPGEVAGARWSEFDGDAWSLPGSRTKNARDHRVPLTPILRAILEDLHRRSGSTPHLFPTEGRVKAASGHINDESVSTALGKIRMSDGKTLGVERFQLRDLRRTTATRLAEIGAEHEIIARVLNHRLSGITERYNRFSYWEPAKAAMTTYHERVRDAAGGQLWPGVLD